MRGVGADEAQHRLQQHDRGDAIDVVIAVDENRFVVAHCAFDPLD